MKVLVACEFSGRVRNAFLERGHDAYSCDLLPTAGGYPERHFQRDVLGMLSKSWDLVIAHPPCTYLCSSGLHWNTRNPDRAKLTQEAAGFFFAFVNSAPKWCIENPVGCMSRLYRKPDQYIQPYEYGEDASKKTALWLGGIPLLEPTAIVAPRLVNGKSRWANQTDSGQNRLGPSEDRGSLRSITPIGVANAMAEQWGGEDA